MKVWYLEGFLNRGRALRRVRVSSFPFRVGRQDDLDLVLDSAGISRVHAEIRNTEDNLVLEDLGSTNGTYLNRERIDGDEPIRSGDIIHFADEEFRIIAEDKITGVNLKMTQQGIVDLPDNLPSGARQLQELLIEGLVTAVYQPIISRFDGSRHAWEMLGRGAHDDLSDSPGVLFNIAESMNLAVQLSELMRRVGVELAHQHDPESLFFTNIHPAEMGDPHRLMNSIDQLYRRYDRIQLVVEIHEAAVADREQLATFTEFLHDNGSLIAYDDFGRGQARLMELADVPPDYVKLDIDLIREIDKASPAKQQMVQMLTRFAHDNGILVVAEGINSDEETAFCDDLNIQYFQGFRYGKPQPLDA